MVFFQGPTLCTLISTSASLSFKYPSIINSYTSHFFSLRLLFLYLLYSVSFCFFLSLKKTQTSLVLLGTKKPTTIVVGFLLRRKRDSNPRSCYRQQFSRLPHSTALPFLQKSYQICSDCGCKYRKVFYFKKQKSDYFLSFLNIIKYSCYLLNYQAFLNYTKI